MYCVKNEHIALYGNPSPSYAMLPAARAHTGPSVTSECISLAGYIPRWLTRPQTFTHPSINLGRHRATTLIDTNALPLCHVLMWIVSLLAKMHWWWTACNVSVICIGTHL